MITIFLTAAYEPHRFEYDDEHMGEYTHTHLPPTPTPTHRYHARRRRRRYAPVRNMVINYPFYFHFYFYIYFKTFSLFLGNVICLETVLQLFTNHCRFIQNCCAKLATERKLRGVSTYLPILEALCSKRVWNTRSATMISSPRPRPSGGQEYIPMSLFDS